jgi:ADP-ribose pyrophosphatase
MPLTFRTRAEILYVFMGKKAELQAQMERQARIDSQWIHQGRFLQVRQDKVVFPHHPPQIWDIVTHSGVVAIIPIDEEGRFLLVEQWRRAIGKITLEIPAGMLEAGEEPITCAQRELQEETGFWARDLTPFGGCYPTPGMSTEYDHLFVAKNLELRPLQAEDTDVIDVRRVTSDEALKLIKEGQICDAKTAVGLLRYLYCC